MKEFYKHPEGKSALVVGLGKSGIGAVNVLKQLGFDVSVQDAKPEEKLDPQLVTYLQNQGIAGFFAEVPENPGEFDLIVLSPGVPPALSFVEEGAAAGALVLGELELAYQLTGASFVAITGTNGKTTTTTLVGEMFRNAEWESAVAGNIGLAVTNKALEAPASSWLVTEVSSFQLETIHEFHPKVAAILNLTPDHMDRHGTMEEYGRVKARVFENQTGEDTLVINYDDEACFRLAKDARSRVVPFSRLKELPAGAFVRDGMLVLAPGDGTVLPFCRTDELIIPGTHNLENALAALAIGYWAGLPADAIARTLRTFSGVEHRIEFVSEIDGVRFVNDSKGTNTDAAVKAIEAINGPIHLIAGGYDKGGEFDALVAAFGDKVKTALLLGKTATRIKDAAERAGYRNTILLKDMEDCVREAFRLASPGDTVLLSPACASWDMYDNYEQRGRHFKDCVKALER